MKEMFRSVFDADYQGYEVFLDKVLKPLFGEQLEVLPVAEDNPTGVSEEAMEKATAEEEEYEAEAQGLVRELREQERRR